MENNNLDKTYGFNNSKEKIEVYTKGDFAVITTQVVADEDSNRTRFYYIVSGYLEGFTLEQHNRILGVRCIVLMLILCQVISRMNAFRTTTAGSYGKHQSFYVQLGDVSYELGRRRCDQKS